MVVEEVSLLILPIIPLGIIIGLYELILIHRDMNFRGSHWIGHGIHSILFIMIGLFITLNTEYFLQITGLDQMDIFLITNVHAIRIAVGIILNIKMHATSSLAKGGQLAARGLAEHWTHTILVSTLVVIAPYVWPFVAPMIPAYLGGLA